MPLPRLHTIDRIRYGLRMWTSPLRRMPSFLIIGAQKSGTSTLYRLLIQHPSAGAAERKEIQYFTFNYHRGEKWYRSRFPVAIAGNRVTGEASPYYLYHPRAASRISVALPQVRLIALLRNPVERAYSHYQHNLRHEREPLSFEEAIDAEESRISGAHELLCTEPHACSFAHQHFSYVDRGHYQAQLGVYLRHFSRDQMMVLKSEAFFQDPAAVWSRVLNFLGLRPTALPEKQAYNVGRYTDMEGHVRDRLTEHYRPHNQRLAQAWDEQFLWSE